MTTPDAHFLPAGERPEKRTRLQEYLEGQQIARLFYLDDSGPTASRGLALELTTGAKLLIFAGRDRNSKYAARLIFRWLARPVIVLPRMGRMFSRGRGADPDAGPADALQERLEGQVIRGVLHRHEPSPRGGECLDVECQDGRLHLEAVVVEGKDHEGVRLLADIEWEWIVRKRARVWMP